MSDRSDLVTVVDRTALIENILSQIIEAFCEPRKERFPFFWTVLLDSSVISMGAKARVVMSVSHELSVRLDQNAIHTVMSLRNAFAHQQTDSHPVLVVGKTSEDDRMNLQLQILTGSGKVTRKNREDALAEFNEAFSAAKSSLVALLEAVKAQQAPGAA